MTSAPVASGATAFSMVSGHIRLREPAAATDNGRAIRVRDSRSIRVPAGAPAGVLATITMDVAMVAASRLGGTAFSSDRLGPDMIGRWAADLGRGRGSHDDIRSEPARRGELGLGLLTHYGTGIILTQAFLLLPRRGNGRPSFPTGTVFGIATAALPLVVLFPSLGYGWFGLRSGSTGPCSSGTPRSASRSGCGRRTSRGAVRERLPCGSSARPTTARNPGHWTSGRVSAAVAESSTKLTWSDRPVLVAGATPRVRGSVAGRRAAPDRLLRERLTALTPHACPCSCRAGRCRLSLCGGVARFCTHATGPPGGRLVQPRSQLSWA